MLMLKENGNGIILTTENVTTAKSKFAFYKEISDKGLERVAHGVYISPDDWVDPEFIVHNRCKAAVFSHDTALYYHNLVDREPIQPTVTIYTGYNTKRLTEDGIKVYTIKRDLLELGKTTITNNMGNEIPVYDLERTLCDLIRSRSSFEMQDFQSAIKAYVRRTDKDLNKLMVYAKAFKVDKILRNYLEVLL